MWCCSRWWAAAVLIVLVADAAGQACPSRCDCRPTQGGSLVHCRFLGKAGFPEAGSFPADTVELDYGHNNITSLEAVPSLPRLEKLVLDECNIKMLGERAFANAPSLRNLTLSRNNIETIHPRAFHGISNLVGLYIEDNNVRELPDRVFDGLGLQDLYLEGNGIHSLSDQTFSGLSVNHLNMKGSNISRLRAEHIRPLKSSLVSFHLDNNGKDLSIDVDTFTGFTSLEVLSVQSSRLQNVEFLLSLADVKTLLLGGNTLPDLNLLSYRDLRSVETLGLSSMGLASFDPSKVLYSLGSLRKLDLSHNDMMFMHSDWFRYTPKLTELNLARNKLFQLPSDMGQYMKDIATLDLAMNNLMSLSEDTFSGMDSLRKLDLRNNKIQVFPSTLQAMFNRIPILLLEGNPLHCNCEMRWYVNWLYTGVSGTAATLCFSPTYTYIFNILPDDFVCSSPIITAEDVVYAEPGSDVYLVCVGEADPAPVVEWTDPNGDALTISPGMDRTKNKTFNTWKLSAISADNEGNYTCSATNVQGNVMKITKVVVTSEPPPTTAAITTTTHELTNTTTEQPTTTTRQTTPKNLTTSSGDGVPHSAGTESTTAKMAPMDTSKSAISQRTLAIIIGMVGALLIISFVIAITVHICRHGRHRRRYDVNDKAIIYHPSTSELNMSKDSRQITV